MGSVLWIAWLIDSRVRLLRGLCLSGVSFFSFSFFFFVRLFGWSTLVSFLLMYYRRTRGFHSDQCLMMVSMHFFSIPVLFHHVRMIQLKASVMDSSFDLRFEYSRVCARGSGFFYLCLQISRFDRFALYERSLDSFDGPRYGEAQAIRSCVADLSVWYSHGSVLD